MLIVALCIGLGGWSCSRGERAERRVVEMLASNPSALAAMEAELGESRREFEAAPDSEEAAIWVGRRLGYLGRFREAVDHYTRALAAHPESYRLLRHRGHRLISLREFARAERDLSRAWELARGRPDRVEPDGQPTPGVPPRGTDQSNILYHLGLARYLRGDYEGASAALSMRDRLEKLNDDNLVSFTHWHWLALRRLGREDEARRVLDAIGPGITVLENHAYERLTMLYRGELSVEDVLAAGAGGGPMDAAATYGAGAWLMLTGQTDRGRRVLRELVRTGNPASFGVIAGEADLRAGR